MAAITVYHGSASPGLVNDGSGQFGALFCANFGYAKNWGEYVYALTVQPDAIMPSRPDEDEVWPALCEVLGIDGDGVNEAQKELLISMIVRDVYVDSNESPAWNDGPDGVMDALQTIAEIIGADGDDLADCVWVAQGARIALAKNLGYAAVWMADEAGSLVVLPGIEAVAVTEEIEED